MEFTMDFAKEQAIRKERNDKETATYILLEGIKELQNSLTSAEGIKDDLKQSTAAMKEDLLHKFKAELGPIKEAVALISNQLSLLIGRTNDLILKLDTIERRSELPHGNLERYEYPNQTKMEPKSSERSRENAIEVSETCSYRSLDLIDSTVPITEPTEPTVDDQLECLFLQAKERKRVADEVPKTTVKPKVQRNVRRSVRVKEELVEAAMMLNPDTFQVSSYGRVRQNRQFK